MRGIQERAVAAGHRPRRHRHAGRGRAQAQAPRARPPRPRPREVHRARLGVEGVRAAARILASSASWAPRADWSRTKFTMDPTCTRGGARGLRAALRRGPDLPRHAPGELGRRGADGALGPRGGDQGEVPEEPTASSSSSRTWSRTARQAPRSSSPPRAPRRCWATPRSRCTPTTRATPHLHGKFVKHPFVDRRIPIICDAELVDPKFGTGAVKVTPAHDFNDFATGKRHKLEEINILNLDGTINAERRARSPGPRPLRRAQGREGQARGEGPRARQRSRTAHARPRSAAHGSIVEPMISTQWFVRMEPLAEPAIAAVEDGRVRILPEEWTKTYFHWLPTSRTGASRGSSGGATSIPAWYCGDCGT
jgi:hypothetical protein